MFISKKVLFAIGGAAILVVGIFIGASSEIGTEAPLLTGQLAAVGGAKTDVSVSPQHSDILQNVGMSENGLMADADDLVRVVRVVDGDTIEVEINGKTEPVRYIGIDTPETVDPRKPVQCFGVEASKKNKELVEGKLVRLEKDITDRDKYNRLLRYIWFGDTLINQALVEQGYAKSYSYPPDVKYQERFIEAQRLAVEEKKGLWSGDCPLPVTPTPKEAEATP